ncbi:LCP family protein [Pseudonocardia endophytica]|nr:LCP family protein [Pseudonocardia endophytica]
MPPPRSEPPVRTRSRAARVGRVALALVSVAVLLVTGYAWTVYSALNGNLSTSDVLAGPKSADGATDILLVGLDSRTDARGNPLPRNVLDALNAGESDGESNTDTMILLRVPDDPSRPTTAVSIPRDSYVNIPGQGKHKINSAYASGAAAERARLSAQGVTGPDLNRESDDAGRRLLAETIGQLTGVSIDHYAEINLAGFAAITTAVGGVPVCLSAPVDDAYSGARFPAGPQTLEGAPALAFVRQRHGLPRGDLDRVVRQQAFLAGLSHQVLSAGTLADPAKLSDLLGAVGQFVVVDPGWDLLAFAGQVKGINGGQIEFRTMPVGRSDLSTPSDGDAVQVDPALVQRFFHDLATGPAPADPSAPAAPSPSQLTVDVQNATSRTGLGAAVQDRLDNDGMVPGTLGNTGSRRSSVVTAATAADADRVAQALGGVATEVDPSLPAGRVSVVLGRDYTGPTSSDGSSAPSDAAKPPGDDAPDAAPADTGPPITADGVPCVS